MSGPEPIAWTGSGSLLALLRGVDGHIWPEQADAHPVPLYSQSALRAAREEALREAAAACKALSEGVTHYGPEPYRICEAHILALIGEKP